MSQDENFEFTRTLMKIRGKVGDLFELGKLINWVDDNHDNAWEKMNKELEMAIEDFQRTKDSRFLKIAAEKYNDSVERFITIYRDESGVKNG